jgi:SAM-dependent methyltransferase
VSPGLTVERNPPLFPGKFFPGQPRPIFEDEIRVKRAEIASHGPLYHILRESAESVMRTRAGTVVDIGGGLGTNLYLLRELVKLDRAISIDLIEPPKDKKTGIEYVTQSSDNLLSVIEPDSVSVVLMIEVLSNLVNPDLGIVNTHSALKSGGELVLSVPNLSALVNRIALLLGEMPVATEVSTVRVFGRPGDKLTGHLRLFTFRALKELVEYHGFTVLKAYTVPDNFSSKDPGAYRRFGGKVLPLVEVLDRAGVSVNSELGLRTLLVARKS